MENDLKKLLAESEKRMKAYQDLITQIENEDFRVTFENRELVSLAIRRSYGIEALTVSDLKKKLGIR